MKQAVLLSGFAVLAAAASMAKAAVTLPPVISSHMVLQRDMAVPIWGTADRGETVTVKFLNRQKQTTADANGNWRVNLDPMPACAEGAELTISWASPDNRQSAIGNLKLTDVLVGEVWVGSGQSNMQMGSGSFVKDDPVLATNLAAAPYPKIRLASAGKPWVEAAGKSLAGFSALLFSFGLPLHKELDVPVGLMVGAQGGTASGEWITQETFEADPACNAVVKAYSAEQAQKEYEEQLATWEKQEAEAKAKGKKSRARKPAEPRKHGECTRAFGHLYKSHILPLQPYGIRGVLWDQGESGTMVEGIDQYTLMGALIRGWRKDWAQGDFPFLYVQKPSGGGCAWDPNDKVTNQAIPFQQLPAAVPSDGAYVENHIRIMQYPNTAMVISSDLGGKLHPVNKSGYGYRAAIVALGMVYGQKVEYYGPKYASHAVEAGKIRVKYTHVGQGLAFKHGDKLQGFAVAGEDKVFQWADAVIDGDTVVVSSAAVPNPMAVRYAWANYRNWANLFNKDALPAVPFRTDSW